VQTTSPETFRSIEPLLAKQINASEIKFVDGPVANSINVVVGTHKFYIETEQAFDSTSQREKLEKELAYQKGFLIAVEKKLSNERFVQNAKPEVVDAERKKKHDAEDKIKAIEESLANL
jgi:valyl-tRNA synthetase